MLSPQSFATILFFTAGGASAIPLHPRLKHVKRTTTRQNAGTGFAIAICIIILAAIFYYLGMHHERIQSWLRWRNAPPAPKPVNSDGTVSQPTQIKTRISCPLSVSSSAPIKPYDSPVEAPTPSLRYFELPIKEIHEMGLPSPKKPAPRESWFSIDRKPWWLLTYPETEASRRSTRTSRSKSMRSWFRSEKSMSNVQEEVPKSTPVLLEAVHADTHSVKEEKERKSDGSTLMDWTGLDHVRRIYVTRKSKIGL
jgi:hypothetical protein